MHACRVIRPSTSRVGPGRLRIRTGGLVSLVVCIGALGSSTLALAQPPAANYEETKVGLYSLPDPLVGMDGERVTSAEAWNTRRRPELMRLFETYMFGKVPVPPHPIKPTFSLSSEDPEALGGKAIRREVAIRFNDDPAGPVIHLLVYLPKQAAAGRRVPAFLGLNFAGNHAIEPRPGDHALDPVDARTTRARASSTIGPPRSRAGPRRRAGRSSGSWRAATPWRRPTTATSTRTTTTASRTGSTRSSTSRARPARPPDEWGAIGAWAWGLSRALDYLETAPEIDARHVAVMGHSRLGQDGALGRGAGPAVRHRDLEQLGLRRGGACIARDLRRDRRADQHVVPALVLRQLQEVQRPRGHAARRPARADRPDRPAARPDLPAPRKTCWADPKGEFLAAMAADPVYRLLGTDGLAVADMARAGRQQLVKSTIGYHIRPGKHDVTTDDWDAFMDFADHHWKSPENRGNP